MKPLLLVVALLLVTGFVAEAQADVAPPRLAGCRVLEVGTTCFIEGTTSGVCAMVKGDKTCVPQPVPSAATSPLIPSVPPPPPAPRPPETTPSSTSGCALAAGPAPAEDAVDIFAILLGVAAIGWRRLRSPRRSAARGVERAVARDARRAGDHERFDCQPRWCVVNSRYEESTRPPGRHRWTGMR